jgi:Mg2+-importing ATPase
VLVRRLEAIEDLGGMDLLCTDKTGTLTVGVMALEATLDVEGAPSADVLRLGHLNAAFETGIENPVDAALVEAGAAAGLATDRWTKIDEIPYDFVRKRLTIVIAERSEPQRHQLIAKGAFAQVLAICGTVSLGTRQLPIDAALRERLERLVQAQGEQGRRVLAVATRIVVAQPSYTIDDEHGLTLAGFLVFADPSKPEVAQTLRDLAAHGVRVKIVTGDSRHVTQHLAGEIGLDPQALLTGQAIAGMRDEALWHDAARTDLFVELEPAQKERVVRALQHAGHAVGYLGDGINDAPALRAADVGISVDSAVDVARESADVVLLRPDLQVLLRGIEDGRRSFVNTMKYISITISANFGNMISMAVATPLLPFLPLTATQILLNNLLSDLPSMALAGDRVEPAALRRAQRWDVAAVRRFMLVFGLTSSAFDLAAFTLLLFVFHAGEGLFRTGWFVVSLLTELGVVVVLRTAGPAWRSRPSTSLLLATAAMLIVAVGLPYLGPTARWFGFEPLPAAMLGALIVLVLAYLLSTEAIKRRLGRQP